ncbi:unnamed protein product [Adineta ricciae]|nr:unnamed protein product [Adineta ricciae]
MATCDALNQQYKSYNEWEENTIETLKKAYPHVRLRRTAGQSTPIQRPVSLVNSNEYTDRQVSLNVSVRPTFIPLTFDSNAEMKILSQQTGPFTKENPFYATVLQNIELTGAHNNFDGSSTQQEQPQPVLGNESPRQRKRIPIPSAFAGTNDDEHHSVRLIVFDAPDLSHLPGDHVCILPENTVANVNGVIIACGWQTGNELLNKPCSLAGYTQNKYQTLRQILTNYVDLTTPLRPHVLNILATYATDSRQQREILELGKGAQRYTDWLINEPTVKETLEQFPSVQMDLGELIQLLPQLQPRYYSISSSSRFHPNQIHISFSVVSYVTPRGVVRKGVCTNYLQQTLPKLSENGQPIVTLWKREPSRVRLFISPNPHFRLPGQDILSSSLPLTKNAGGDAYLPLNCPLLMFAVGSGIAPFRAFWQELQVLERRLGSVQVERVLFMGCRTPNDFVYAMELRELTSKTSRHDKLFTAVIPVYSREKMGVKRYIQDAMLTYEDMIYSLLNQENAFIYMCGSVRSCQGIESALASIVQSCNEYDLTLTQANNIIKQYKEDGRIKQDMFG